MSSWPFMACDEIRKRHFNDRTNATILKSMKNVSKEEHGIIQIKPTDNMQKLNTLLAFCIRECVTIDHQKKYKSIMDSFKTSNNKFWRHYWRLLAL